MNQEDKPTEGNNIPEHKTSEEFAAMQKNEDNDFPLGKACDLSGEGTCDSCQ